MEHFVIDTDSWHYKLVEKASYQVSEDICGYTRQLIWSLFLAAFASLIVALIAGSSGSLLMWAVVCVEYGIWLPLEWHSGLAAALLVVCLFVGPFFYALDNPEKVYIPGFVRTAYGAFHDKFCVPLKFHSKI